MKKIVAIFLTVLLIATMSITVLADNTDSVDPSQSQTNIPLKKLYKITGATDVTASADVNEVTKVYPHEVLTFDITPATTNPTTQEITVAPLTTTDALEYDEETGTFKSSMEITLPNYTHVGEYVYTIEEVAPETPSQAVSYSTDPITVTVLVYYNDTHTELLAELYLTQTTAAGGTQTSQVPTSDGGTTYKVDTFVNKYAVGHLNVTKTVAGKLGSQEQEFDIHVKFTSANPVTSDITYVDTSDNNKVYTIPYGTGWTEHTETIHVKHDETVYFYNIPVGVEYEIEEDAKHGENDSFDPNSPKDTDYKIEYDTNQTGTIAENSTLSTTVTNTKDHNVATGIVLDSMPYVLILVVAVVGFVAIVGKKRREV